MLHRAKIDEKNYCAIYKITINKLFIDSEYKFLIILSSILHVLCSSTKIMWILK